VAFVIASMLVVGPTRPRFPEMSFKQHNENIRQLVELANTVPADAAVGSDVACLPLLHM